MEQSKFYQIKNVTEHEYTLVGSDGSVVTHPIQEVDKIASVFTIQDAKDGDVLHSIGFHNDCIFIFDRLDNWKFDEPNGDRAVATGYCCLFVSADKMEFGMQGPDCIEVNTIKPATKEQRGTLEKAMADAGYTFDFEKKELKKIEQKLEENPLISLKDFQEAFELKARQYDIDLPNRGYDIHAMCKELYSLLILPKQEWSEDDEEIIDYLIDYLETELDSSYTDLDKETFTKEINWLKSLKDRYTWKPSNEQLDALQYVYRNINPPLSDKLGWDSIRILELMYQDLKKLRDK